MPLQHWLQLALTEGIGPILSRRIIDARGSSSAASAASATIDAARDWLLGSPKDNWVSMAFW